MKFLHLLGQPLKGADVIEVLELFDMIVVYDFDRLHEGTQDRFWSESKPNGFQFRFDESQRLDVIFLYVAPHSGFLPANLADTDVPTAASLEAARAEFERRGLRYKAGDSYIKALYERHSVHYEFRDGVLALITVTLLKV